MAEKMNPEIKVLWIEALESGEYKQCKGYLTRRDEDGIESHCCLGVLTELAVKAGVTERSVIPEEGYSGQVRYGLAQEGSTAPTEVWTWAGLENDNPLVPYGPNGAESLAGLNDEEDMTFAQIAEIIREQL